MMVIPVRKIALALVVCCSGYVTAIAQPSLKTTVDKDQILIGEQIQLKVVATMPRQDFFVKWIEIPDTLQHFELVERSKIDSAFSNQKLTGLSQILTFTSFDSGKWTLPAFNIDFNPSNGDSSYNLYTDTFPVTVSYQADTTNALRDIKDIRGVTKETPLWYWFAAAAALLLLIALGIWLYVKKPAKKTAPLRLALSPYQLAMMKMNKLNELNLDRAPSVKQYHAGLSEILRQYLSSVYGHDLISSTTGEILILLNQKGLDKTVVSKIAEALRTSDAAKFAKYVPPAEESNQSWQVIKQAIDLTEQLQHKKEESGT